MCVSLGHNGVVFLYLHAYRSAADDLWMSDLLMIHCLRLKHECTTKPVVRKLDTNDLSSKRMRGGVDDAFTFTFTFAFILRTGMCSQSCKLTSAVHIRITKKSCPYIS
jgi:hypothetical protein